MKNVHGVALERGKLGRAVGACYCRPCCSGTPPTVIQVVRDDPRDSDPRFCLEFRAVVRSAMQAKGIVWEWYGRYKEPIRLCKVSQNLYGQCIMYRQSFHAQMVYE